MAKVDFVIETSKDRATIRFGVHREGEPIGWAELDGSEVDGLIRMLAKHRRELADPVPLKLDPVVRIADAEMNPAWTLQAQNGGASLVLRHGGIGWIGYWVPAHEAQGLSEALRRATTPKSPPRQP